MMPDPTSAPLIARLRHRERWRLAKAAAKLTLGPPLCLLGPLALATAFSLCQNRLGFHIAPFFTMFIALTLLMLPTMLWLEARTRGQYLQEATAYGQPSRWQSMSVGPPIGAIRAAAHVAAQPRATAGIFVEIFLAGPRLLLNAAEEIRAWRTMKPANRALAATLLRVLADSPEGLPPDALAKAEPPADRARALAYLAWQGWIGVRDDGQRVYLYSDERAALSPP
jgi:hypothetical protein